MKLLEMTPPPQTTSFAAPYDGETRLISAIACIGLLAIALVLRNVYIAFVVALVVALFIGAVYAYSPRRYTIAGRSIIVKRLAGNAAVTLEDVRTVRPAVAGDFQGCIRLRASGGLFGYFGLFRTNTLGKCTWYVTDRKHIVVIVTGTATTLFSPDDVPGFMAAIRACVPVPETPEIPAVEPADAILRPRRIWIHIVPLSIGAILAVPAFVITRYSPGPPSYSLTAQSLTIHDRFYPVTLQATSVDVDGIRMVDIMTDAEWRPITRTNGFKNANYASGWFRVASGVKVRMYRARARRLILLPPRGAGVPVLLEVKDPERLMADIQREWAGPR